MDQEAAPEVVCIFCARTRRDVLFNREHIIPQNIGGTLYLDDAVCVDCNSNHGSRVDVEILKLPDVLQAFEALGLSHNRDGIINRYYSITGKAENVEFKSGKARGQDFHFPEQRLSDGSLITHEPDSYAALNRTVKRDKRLREAGLSAKEIQRRLGELCSLCEQAKPGDEIRYPVLGITLRKCFAELSINVMPRQEANIHPLIAKIAYEMIYFCGGAEFFSDANSTLKSQLLACVEQRKIQKDIYVTRVKPAMGRCRPVHFVFLEFPHYITMLRVGFFGHIEYVLMAQPLSRAFVDKLKGHLGVHDLYAIAYQQELDTSTKSFYAITEENEVTCIGAI